MRKAAILVVEDNKGDVMLIEEALRVAGIDADMRILHDGEVAQQALSSPAAEAPAHVDLILLDLSLPRGDGFELLRAARTNPLYEQTPIVVLSSSMAPSDREKALRLGANLHIRKPMTLDEFLKMVGDTVTSLLPPDVHIASAEAQPLEMASRSN